MHAQSWTHVLGSTGVENARTTLAKTLPAGSQAGVWIGGAVITKGFAEHWLAWHDREAKRAGRFRFWIAVGGAVVVATIAALLTLSKQTISPTTVERVGVSTLRAPIIV